MTDRPKIKLKLSITDKIFEILGGLLIIVFWIYTISNYSTLPNTIPTHYNIAGEADGFGSKVGILTLPLIATIFYIGMTILNKSPHLFNYPSNITLENAARQYTFATRLIRYLKLILIIVFGSITFQTIKNVNEGSSDLSIWFLPLTLGLIFIPLIYYIVKLSKN